MIVYKFSGDMTSLTVSFTTFCFEAFTTLNFSVERRMHTDRRVMHEVLKLQMVCFSQAFNWCMPAVSTTSLRSHWCCLHYRLGRYFTKEDVKRYIHQLSAQFSLRF